MVEESFSNTVPQVDLHTRPDGKTKTAGDSQTAVKKSASATTAGKPAGKQNRLTLHLLIGFLMVSMAVGGYAFHVSDVSAATDKAGYRLIDVSTNVVAAGPESITTSSSGSIMPVSARTSDLPAMSNNLPTSDFDRLQAEMDEITRRINAIKAESLAVVVAPTPVTSSPIPGSNGVGGSNQTSGSNHH